jgi:hypothetical protein
MQRLNLHIHPQQLAQLRGIVDQGALAITEATVTSTNVPHNDPHLTDLATTLQKAFVQTKRILSNLTS